MTKQSALLQHWLNEKVIQLSTIKRSAVEGTANMKLVFHTYRVLVFLRKESVWPKASCLLASSMKRKVFLKISLEKIFELGAWMKMNWKNERIARHMKTNKWGRRYERDGSRFSVWDWWTRCSFPDVNEKDEGRLLKIIKIPAKDEKLEANHSKGICTHQSTSWHRTRSYRYAWPKRLPTHMRCSQGCGESETDWGILLQ